MRQTKHNSNGAYYFGYPTNMGCFFRYLSPSLRRFCLYQHLIFQRTVLRQDVLQQPEANTDLFYFSALSYYKNYRIFALELSC